jgi:ferrochelatase
VFARGEKVAVLLLAYGGPADLDEVDPFLRRIMAPREPSPESLARAVERYRAIGGSSPLVENTLLQARLLQERLDSEEAEFVVLPGMRHTGPTIADAVRRAAESDADAAVAVIMASHQSDRATGAYAGDLALAWDGLSDELKVRMPFPSVVAPWHTSPAYLEAVAGRVEAALRTIEDLSPSEVTVVFTAHSLPLLDGTGDPDYEGALEETVMGVMQILGPRPWRLAYQSASPARGARWLGPAVEDVVHDLAQTGTRGVVVAPLGFVSEHLETLYDLDIELARVARDLGLTMARAGTVHDSPLFIEALAGAVTGAPASDGPPETGKQAETAEPAETETPPETAESPARLGSSA